MRRDSSFFSFVSFGRGSKQGLPYCMLYKNTSVGEMGTSTPAPCVREKPSLFVKCPKPLHPLSSFQAHGGRQSAVGLPLRFASLSSEGAHQGKDSGMLGGAVV